MATTSLVPTSTTQHVDYLPPPDPQAVERAMLKGDISQMSDQERIAYYVATCKSLGLNPLTKPFLAMKGEDGKEHLYPDKGCAEQLRKLHRVSIKVLGREIIDGLYVVTVQATTPDGREEEAQGVVPLVKAKGTWKDYEYNKQQRRRFVPDVGSDGQEVMVPLAAAERANAIMRAESKAKRRVTLAICGLGLPDWDAEPTSAAHPMALKLQAPSRTEAGKTTEAHVADLFGDTVRSTPPPPEEPLTDHEEHVAKAHAVINSLLYQLEIDPGLYWEQMATEFPDLQERSRLVALYDSLKAEVDRRAAAQTPTPPRTEPELDLWQREEREAHANGEE